ncbi:MAG: alkaline phosphatase family protein [Thermodesulfobacteriota bacterium]
MPQPDYEQSIVNLMASIATAYGGEEGAYPPLAALAGRMGADRPVVLLIVDGLGDIFLKDHADSFLWQHRQGRLTSVFPPTTASAITSFFTGVAPQQHAITGWHTYFKELGAVATVLPFIPRYRGASFTEAGVRPDQILDHTSLLADLSMPCHVVLPDNLVDSAYSKTLCGPASRHGYDSMAAMFNCVNSLLESGSSAFVLAYLAEFDSLAHEHGIGSDEVEGYFQLLDDSCRTFLPSFVEHGSTVLVSADHGLIDTEPGHVIALEDHPQLAATLTLPLCGEPRCAYCYVHSDKRHDFERYVTGQLAFACQLHRSSELIDQGYLGMATPSPRLTERVGEYVLLMKGNYIIKDRLIGEKRFHQVGVHGGLSAEELFVPLIMLE